MILGVDQFQDQPGTNLLIGMLLDQQVPMEWAFLGPATLTARLGHLDPARIAALDTDAFVAICAQPPAIHRFPASMGRRIHDLCRVLATDYGADGAAVWHGVRTGEALYTRLRSLPGYGDEKARIMVAILGKRMGVRPSGWRKVAGKFGESTPRCVADINSPESLAKVKEWKRSQKATGRDKQDRPLPADQKLLR